MNTSRISFIGLVATRKERWVLTRRGILFVLALFFALIFVVLRNLFALLSHSERIDSENLVIDGGMPVHLLPLAAQEFLSHSYREVWVVHGFYLPNISNDSAEGDDYIIQILARHGIPRERMHLVAFSSFQIDRISTSAAELKAWFSRKKREREAFNVAASGPEARRTLVLYRRVWGSNSQIGVIPLDDPAYDGIHWWRSSEGIREVFFESITFIFAVFFFWPSS